MAGNGDGSCHRSRDRCSSGHVVGMLVEEQVEKLATKVEIHLNSRGRLQSLAANSTDIFSLMDLSITEIRLTRIISVCLLIIELFIPD